MFNHSSWIVVATPTDRPKSIYNRCVIDVLVASLCCRWFVEFSVDMRILVVRVSQIPFFFSLNKISFIKDIFQKKNIQSDTNSQ